jgi:acyl-CoA dehydrogenase
MQVLNVPTPAYLADEEFSIFRNSVGRFLDDNAPPEKFEGWRRAKVVERDLWTKAGAAGLLGLSTSTAYGGIGGDFRHETILIEEAAKRGIEGWGASLHNAIVMPYIEIYGTEDQKKRWLPKLARGDYVGAIAMTEPGTGSDLQAVKTSARRSGNQYVINGSKTFITNGQTANLVIVVSKTDPAQGAKGTSLIVVETDEAEGFERGRNLHKIGLEAADRQPHRHRGRPRLLSAHGSTAAGATDHRRPQHRHDRARARRHYRLRQGAQDLRPTDHRQPSGQVQARRMQDRGDGRANLH